jgi:ribosomal protein L11 methyltransferase
MKLTKPLWRLAVATSLEAEEAVTELLAAATNKAAAAYFNLENGVSLVSVFSDKPFQKSIRNEIAAGLKEIAGYGLKIGAGKIEITKLKREDWAESWKKHFKAMEIGRALLVKPSWIKRLPRKGQAVVMLDPGLSFGTGQHATTSFCLAEIVRFGDKNSTSKSFLDIGTGSGILAIAADKLGFTPVQAFDFDPESVRVAKINALTNKSSKTVKIFRGDVTKLPARAEKQFDLVCANLISNLLIAERKRIVARVKRSGTLVLAGILATEFTQVQRAFEALGMKLVASKVEKEWRSGSFEFV